MRYRILFALLLFASLLLASCGGTPTPAVTTEPAASDTTEPVTEVTTEPVTEPITDPVTEEIILSEFEKIEPANGKKVKIACIGDSITYGYGLTTPAAEGYPAQLQKMLGNDYAVGNFGQSGAYALPADNKYNVKEANLYYRNTTVYRNSLKYEADVVIIMLGTNDIRSMSCAEAKEDFVKAIKSLAEEYAALPTVKKVYIASSIYTPSADVRNIANGELSRLTKQAADELGFTFIDAFAITRDYMEVHHHQGTDRVHPSKEGALQIAKTMYAALMETEADIDVYPVSETGVVFVNENAPAGGDGSTPETAVNGFGQAVCLLRKSGGTVVLSGPCTINYTCHLPDTEKPIKVTSVYNGVDYRATANAKLSLKYALLMYGDFEYDDMEISSLAKNLVIVCNYNDVTIGSGVTCTVGSSSAGSILLVVGANGTFGGEDVEQFILRDECNIAVNGGTWMYIRAGNRRNYNNSPIGGVAETGKLTITVNGGTYTNTGGNLTAATGMNSNYGECNLIINGGTFKGAVYGVARVGVNETAEEAVMSGTVNLVINGGTFAGKIIAVQDNTVKVTGSVNITYAKAYESKISGNFTSKTVK